jgi:hypothetical protein
VRSALAAAWIQRGLEARARAAGYARFSFELLQVAAPSALSRAAAQAVQNELDGARSCFELAQRHGAPRPRAVPAAPQPPEEGDLAAITLRCVRDGCITATIYSVQSGEELEHCQDPATREVLASLRQARADEAQLSWRFLSWVVKRADRQLVDQVRVAFLGELREHGERLTLTDWHRQLLRRGVTPADQGELLRQHVLRNAVIPCMEAALPLDQ